MHRQGCTFHFRCWHGSGVRQGESAFPKRVTGLAVECTARHRNTYVAVLYSHSFNFGFQLSAASLRRQTIYPTELRAHSWLLFHSTTLTLLLQLLALQNSWSTWSSAWNGETDAHPVCFIPSTIRSEFHPRIKFRHGLRLGPAC